MTHLKRRRIKAVILVAAILVAGLAIWRLPWPPLYQVTVLPSLGSKGASASGLNDRGQVVGIEYYVGQGPHLFLWDRDSGIQDLDPVSDHIRPRINNAGEISGVLSTDDRNHEAFVWEPGKGRTMLGTLGPRSSTPVAMNSQGQIVGVCSNFGGRPPSSRAFIWDKVMGMRELTTPDGRPCHPTSINDKGQILAYTIDANERYYWFLLDPNGLISLNATPSRSVLTTMNNASCAAGLDVGTSNWHVIFVDKQRTWTRLFPADPDGMTRLNDSNQIAWTEFTYGLWSRLRVRLFNEQPSPDGAVSYLWDPARGRICLNRYVRSTRWFRVEDLNNNGAIIGSGETIDGRTRSVLLEPIPQRWGR